MPLLPSDPDAGPWPQAAAQQIVLPAWLYERMLAHVTACLPEEACGLVGGQFDGQQALARQVLPVENMLHSATRFRMDPAEQLKGFYQLEDNGLDLVAIFHSHPAGPVGPSPTDVAEFAYPGVLTLIWSRGAAQAAPWTMRAYAIEGTQIFEVAVVVDDTTTA